MGDLGGRRAAVQLRLLAFNVLFQSNPSPGAPSRPPPLPPLSGFPGSAAPSSCRRRFSACRYPLPYTRPRPPPIPSNTRYAEDAAAFFAGEPDLLSELVALATADAEAPEELRALALRALAVLVRAPEACFGCFE